MSNFTTPRREARPHERKASWGSERGQRAEIRRLHGSEWLGIGGVPLDGGIVERGRAGVDLRGPADAGKVKAVAAGAGRNGAAESLVVTALFSR